MDGRPEHYTQQAAQPYVAQPYDAPQKYEQMYDEPMMKEAMIFLHGKIPTQTNKNVTIENVSMRAAFISYQSTMIQLQESLKGVHLDTHGSKYRLAEKRMTAQPFCSEWQLDFIILHWVKDRRVAITLDDLVKVEAANEWIRNHHGLREQRRKDRGSS